MSEKSDGIKRALDLSEFEAEFPSSANFDELLERNRQEELSCAQYEQKLKMLAQCKLDYDRAMQEVELPHKTNPEKLKHLSEAYLAAIDLDPHGLLPEANTLKDLQVRIIAVKALIEHAASKGWR